MRDEPHGSADSKDGQGADSSPGGSSSWRFSAVCRHARNGRAATHTAARSAGDASLWSFSYGSSALRRRCRGPRSGRTGKRSRGPRVSWLRAYAAPALGPQESGRSSVGRPGSGRSGASSRRGAPVASLALCDARSRMARARSKGPRSAKSLGIRRRPVTGARGARRSARRSNSPRGARSKPRAKPPGSRGHPVRGLATRGRASLATAQPIRRRSALESPHGLDCRCPPLRVTFPDAHDE